MKIIGTLPASLEPFKSKDIFLVAATLRPETMHGQTNCWILPRGQYGAFETLEGEIFVCSDRAALSMSL